MQIKEIVSQRLRGPVWRVEGVAVLNGARMLPRPLATVMDAGLKGVELAWASGAQVLALDSQGALERAPELQYAHLNRGSRRRFRLTTGQGVNNPGN